MINNKDKHIYFVTGYMSNGGAERVISVLANEFANKGYKVTILAILGDKRDYEINNNVVYIPYNNKSSNKILRIVRRLLFIRNHINKSNNNIVISFMAQINIYTIISNVFNSAKLIVSERNDPHQDPSSKLIRRIRDVLYNFADGLVFQTPDAQRYFTKKIQKKSIIISNPLSSILPKPFSGERKKVIVTATRLAEQKNLKLLLDAFYKLQLEYPDYKLKIYGEGPLKEELGNYVINLKMSHQVSFPGFSKDLHNEINDASMFVLSSNYEGISNSLIEALALGIPVISTDHPIGGAKMYIKPGYNGILVPVRDINALYSSMKKLIETPSLNKMYSKNAVDIRIELDIKKIIEKWETFIFKRTM